MIKNRYFKSLQGVPFELLIGKSNGALTSQLGTSSKKWEDYVENSGPNVSAVGDIIPIRTYAAAGQTDGRYMIATTVAWDTIGAAGSAPTNPRSTFIQFANCIQTSVGPAGAITALGKWNMTTPLLASSIQVTNFGAGTAGTYQVAKVLYTGTYVAGQTLRFKVIETTPGNQNLPVWDYEVTLTSATIATWVAAAATAIQTQVARGLQGEWFAVTATDTNTSLTVTSTDYNRTFKLASVIEDNKTTILTASAPVGTYSVTTAPVLPWGTADHVNALIMEDAVRRGVGHYYPDQNATAAEFGTPDATMAALVTALNTSPANLVLITGVKTEASPTPVEQHINNKHHIWVVTDSTEAAILKLQFPY
jgi:hypothetical protein